MLPSYLSSTLWLVLLTPVATATTTTTTTTTPPAAAAAANDSPTRIRNLPRRQPTHLPQPVASLEPVGTMRFVPWCVVPTKEHLCKYAVDRIDFWTYCSAESRCLGENYQNPVGWGETCSQCYCRHHYDGPKVRFLQSHQQQINPPSLSAFLMKGGSTASDD
ncbi:hypothetical protein O9K51_00599 [Purpureocillium lavendulum]|uniref:Uncharacterized protein n=1 Tax=Purpureocillium lavendulum TaxID=1247861 RepID=A0AB34G4V3_9HYPO|nr:hypothetical protein O9K51_00599 [Purpureocillium lavendulum]